MKEARRAAEPARRIVEELIDAGVGLVRERDLEEEVPVELVVDANDADGGAVLERGIDRLVLIGREAVVQRLPKTWGGVIELLDPRQCAACGAALTLET